MTSQGPLLFLNDLGSTYGTAARLGIYFVVSFDRQSKIFVSLHDLLEGHEQRKIGGKVPGGTGQWCQVPRPSIDIL